MIYYLFERALDFERYADLDGYLGSDLWRSYLEPILSGPAEALDWHHEDNPVHRFRVDAEGVYASRTPMRPMVFVSHSHNDIPQAIALAQAIHVTHPRYDVWLDVWDPTLTAVNASLDMPERRKAILIALAVEMGLLNSTRLVAILTPASVGSAWIPYEYGRVKPSSVFSTRVSARLPAPEVLDYEPEYLRLGEEFRTDQAVLDWLSHDH